MRRLAIVLTSVVWLFTAPAQAQEVRLAAPSDCLTNTGCGLGLKSAYGLDVRSAFVPLTVADAGISALDDGTAEIAVAFSSNPQVSRPDIVTLRDDRSMIYPDRVVPAVRRGLLRSYGSRAKEIRKRLNGASAALNTLALRGLNQSVIDGRLPEAVGGEFVDANGLGGTAKRKPGKRIVVGFMDFDENETLAHLYAEALRAGGFRVVVRSVRGLRPEAVRKLRRDQIDLYPAYDGSLLRYLVGTSPERLKAGLRRTLARIDVEPMRLSRAQDSNVFVTKTETASRLGIAKLSDLARYWQAAGS
ncbi:substrate binding protein of glycine betaine ABC transport system [Solirubrobacter pauli]|uniref:Substrate binding protein of glycine betaine ABC transport system n=1 Tax=Solirubrobacter pauli TaxID=166793 RepID=A0A660LF00_9ACTN|nr:glycine betaine ABC transporter substrate-binding protein [Solirubrobacter pauli]RKQ93149.1 substrate binding protein of glycine betaine ABC transport system [Solirubrobacter pauli]